MTDILNLDDLVDEPKGAISINGQTHEMAKPTIKRAMTMMAKTEKAAMGVGSSGTAEMKLGIEIILDAFPSLTTEIVEEMTLTQVTMLVEYVQSKTASIVTKSEEEAKGKNDQKAS